MKAQNFQAIDGKADIRSLLQQGQCIKPVRIRCVRNRIGTLGNQVKALAFPQVAGVKAALILFLAAEKGQMESVYISVVILDIFPCTGR